MEMEMTEEKNVKSKTLSGVSPISQESDDPQTILKPSMEETVGDDLRSVVVTTTVVEKTEVSVVKMVQQEDECMKNQGEGVFGNLVDEDEGKKVNCSENGTSVGMDVDGSLAGENGSHENPVFEGVLADERDENAIRDPMDIDNGAEIVESKKDMSKNDEENVENREDKEEEGHDFVVGDFVWGKIKSHPWWPGQIYDPCDASDYAATLKRKDGLLVAYFGDGSFSWCSPSQLKPFIDNFQEMSKQSDSKKFVNAVQKVLEEVSRHVKAELICKCQTGSITENAGMVNKGIKEGARVPKGNTIKVLMDRIEPVDIVSTLKAYATMELGTKPVDLELTVLKSCLSAFYYTKKGGHLLVDYHDPKCIEGLEVETRSGVADSDIIGPSESPENGDDKLYQKRKQKSVAELLGEDESKIKKAKTTKDGGRRDRKRKTLVVSVTPESDHDSGGGTGGGGGVEEETMSPRQRKKSRYLSPPYLSPIGIGSGKFSVLGSGTGSGSFKEPKAEPEKVPEMAAEPKTEPEDSLKKSSGKRTREKRRVREGSDSQEQKKAADTGVNVTKVLDGLLRAALDPSSFVEKEKNLPAVTELVSSFRSSVFEEGSREQTDKKRDGDDTSVLAFIKQKLEWMSEMVQICGESEMSADVKASLQGGMHEVLEKVVKMRGK
ncbi:hypothetical protein L1987_43826 [Smallanthus sonchifolius]|uniref:Uncharacterized protein n=1 Tax=Smallanthus sonchifolius TaxID=185202 RepID=A0ACB9GNY1_9ASTR|nr:hypothetical protein L1987_43826 [Smallanthus sonchifolius]